VSQVAAVDCDATSSNVLAEGVSCSFGGITYTCSGGIVSGGPFSTGEVVIGDFSVSCQ